ncbi:MAG: hypothetical protein H6625_09495 [Bdellovibrionaceae bacterium]|nr:hypothetical protein [Pseudobdellovibrionaceae bacterium]
MSDLNKDIAKAYKVLNKNRVPIKSLFIIETKNLFR